MAEDKGQGAGRGGEEHGKKAGSENAGNKRREKIKGTGRT